MGYSKLFSEIVMSTIWREPDHVRILWVTMLALKDRWHKVNASIPGLADAARITLDQCNEALFKLSSPDPYSRTKTNEGRRIQAIDGGWLVINGEVYRNKMSLDERREYNRLKQKEYYNNKKSVQKSVHSSTSLDSTSSTCTHTDSDTDSDTRKNKSSHERYAARIKLVTTDYSWEGITEQDRKQWQASFPGVNLDIELAKAAGYIKANPTKIKKNWSRYLFNWFNRVQERGGNPIKSFNQDNGHGQMTTRKSLISEYFKKLGRSGWTQAEEIEAWQKINGNPIKILVDH